MSVSAENCSTDVIGIGSQSLEVVIPFLGFGSVLDKRGESQLRVKPT